MSVNGNINVLLVDDDPSKILVLKSVLSDILNIALIEATSGEEALRYLLHQDIAVILLDVNMPGMDGFETAQLIRQRPHTQHTPIIFVTAISTAEIHIMKGYAIGAVDYILTPIVPDILRAKVKVFVDLFDMTKQLERQSIALKEANQILEGQLKEIERLNLELDIVNQDLKSFSYSVAHDMRAPLRHIAGFVKILATDYAGHFDEEGEKLLERVLRATHTLDEIIEDLLKLSRITQQQIEQEDVDLSEMASTICNSIQGTQPERQAEFIIAHDLRTAGDRGLLRIALENLLGNAWKYSGKQPKTRIEFGRADLFGKDALYVRDNGAGFDGARATELFVPFRRLHSSSEFPGTGIGLAIVHRIIRRHGGRIWAESEVGKGATFYFTL